MQLVSLSNNQTMSSREIAKLTGKRHEHVVRDIKSMLESIHPKMDNVDFKEYFAKYKDLNGRTVIDHFDLPKRETLILVSGYNVLLRSKIIDRWVELEQKELSKAIHTAIRGDSKFEYKAMGVAIQNDHEEIKPHHFSNEADLINRIVLGMTSSKFKKHHDVEKGELIRDYMTTEQLNCIVSLQRANTVYIEDGLDFQDRKEKLTSLFNRKHKQKLIEEIHLLEA